jgi:hypothetical protein
MLSTGVVLFISRPITVILPSFAPVDFDDVVVDVDDDVVELDVALLVVVIVVKVVEVEVLVLELVLVGPFPELPVTVLVVEVLVAANELDCEVEAPPPPTGKIAKFDRTSKDATATAIITAIAAAYIPFIVQTLLPLSS